MKRIIFNSKFLIIIIIVSMFLLLFPTGKSEAATENYFFIGDSRTYHTVTYYPTRGTETRGNFAGKIVNQSAVDYSYVGTSYGNWFSSGGTTASKLNALSSAPNGTKVIVWLGVNDIASSSVNPTTRGRDYVNAVKALATKYPKLIFCQISVTAVHEPSAKNSYSSYLNNARIDEINNEMKKQIDSLNMSNYKYIDVNSEVKSDIVNNNPTVGDGLHYTSQMYTTIANKIYDKVSKISSGDTTAPTLSSISVTSPTAGTYKAGQTVKLVSTFSENIYGTASAGKVTSSNAPKLTIKFGSGQARTATFSSVSGKTITYTYKIQSGDTGKLTINGYTGNVYDKAGNKLAVSKKTLSGNVITADTIAPTLSGISVTSPLTGTYKAGETIKFVSTFSENIYGTASEGKVTSSNAPKLTIKFGSGQARAATFGSVSGKKITYTYKIQSGDNGKLAINEYTGNVYDVAGNKLAVSKKTLSGNGITADTIVPTLSSVKVNTPGAGTYRAGQTITIVSTFSENIYGTASAGKVTSSNAPKLTLKFGAGQVRNATFSSVSGKTITYTYKIQSGDNGTLAINAYSGTVYDVVGNKLSVSKPTLGGNKIVADTLAPTCTITTSPTSPTNAETITYTFTWNELLANDSFDIDDVTVTNGTKVSTKLNSVAGNRVYTLQVKNTGTCTQTVKVAAGKCTDEAGNSNTAASASVVIDRTPPTLEVTGNPTTWVKEGKLKIKALDANSGLENVKVNGKVIPLTNNQATITLNKNNVTYEIIATDKVGNNSTKQTITVTKVDQTPPTLKVTGNPTTWVKEGQLTIEATDSESDISEVTVNGQATTITNGRATIRLNKNNVTYEIIAKDNVGNSSSKETIKVTRIDQTVPTLEITGNPTTWVKEGTLTIKATDAESGIDHVKINNKAVALNNGQTTIKLNKNNVTYKIAAVDKVGNSTDEQVIEVTKIDTTAPGLTVTGNPTDWVQEATLTIKATDSESGIKQVTVNGKKVSINNNGQGRYDVYKNGNYEIIATDNAGNISDKKVIKVTKIDTENPSVEVTGNPTTWVKEATLTIKAIENGSAIKSVTVNGTSITLTNGIGTYKVTQNGEYKIEVTDNVGHKASETEVVDKIDRTAPSVEVTGNPENWVQEATLTIKATDSQSGVKQVTVNGNKVTLKNGKATYKVTQNGKYEIVAKDNVDNESEKQIVNVTKIDGTLPAVEVTGNPENWVQEATLTIKASKNGAEIQSITVNGQAITLTNGQGTYKVTQNGEYKIVVTDSAQNKTTVTETVDKIDRSNPQLEVTGNPENWVKTAVLTIKAEDNESGVQSVTVNGKNVELKNGQVSCGFTTNGDYKIVVKDNAGNETSKTERISKIDKTNPTLEITKDTEENVEEITLTIKAADTESGIKQVKVNGEKLTLKDGQGQYTVTQNGTYEVLAIDKVGNETQEDVVISNIINNNGDLNGNGKVDSNDLLKIMQHIVAKRTEKNKEKWTLEDEKQKIADVNKDGKIDQRDVLRIKQYLAASRSEEIAKKHPEWLNI